MSEAEAPGLEPHLETREQQFEAANLGMWAFLVQEILFFGGLFAATRCTAVTTTHVAGWGPLRWSFSRQLQRRPDGSNRAL